MALSDYCTGKTTVAVRTGSGTVVRGGPRRVRALKEVELAEELAEVLLRRRYAQDAWSEAQCRRAGEAAAAAVALARTEARAGRAASG